MANIKISDLPLIANIPPTSGEFPIVYNNVTYKMNWSQLNNQITASGANPLNVTGTGTTGNITKWTTGGSVIGDSLITDNGSVVTITSNADIDGTLNVTETLTVDKTATSAIEIAKFKVSGTGGINGNESFVSILPGSNNFTTQLRLNTNNTGNNFQTVSNKSGVLELATTDGNPIVLKTNNSTRLTINGAGVSTFTNNIKIPNSGTIGSVSAADAITILSGGQVGIGGTPSYDFHVFGSIMSIQGPTASVRLYGTGINMIFDLKSDSGLFIIRDVNNGRNVYSADPGVNGYQRWYINGTQKMTLDSGGNLGIGTDLPSAKLTIDVGGGSSAPTSFTTANSYLQLGTTSYNSAGAVYSIGFGYTGGSTNSPAYIGLKQTDTGNATKGDLVFLTRDSTDDIAPTERLRISSGGNVGIGGITSPTYRIEANTTSGGNGIKILRGADSMFEEFQSTAGIVSLAASGSNGSFSFRTGTTVGTTTPRLTISSGGVATFSNYIDTPEVRQGGEFMIGRSSNIIRVGSGDASDSLTFYAGGSERMSISSGGQVAIGNSNPETDWYTASGGGYASLQIGQSSFLAAYKSDDSVELSQNSYLSSAGVPKGITASIDGARLTLVDGAFVFQELTTAADKSQTGVNVLQIKPAYQGRVIQQQDYNWSFGVSKTYTSTFTMFTVECDLGDHTACIVTIAGSKRSPGSNDHVGIKQYSCFKLPNNNWVVVEEIGAGYNNDITYSVSTTQINFISPFAGNNNYCNYSVKVMGAARSNSSQNDLRVISFG